VTLLLSIFAVLAGLAFGSFLNVCVCRLPRHESVVAPRSRCPVCLRSILNRDNIPVLSWVLLRGRCRSCGARIPIRYPLIEAATAALFLLCLLRFGSSLAGVGAAVFCWLLLGLAATDAETMLLPDALTLPGLAIGVVYSGLRDSPLGSPLGLPLGSLLGLPLGSPFSWRAVGESLLWAGCAGGFILLIRGAYWLVRRREGIGLGDAKLLAMIAAWLGLWPTVLSLFLGVVGAAVYGLLLVAVRRGRTQSLRVPLGAFLSAAAIFTVFEGDAVIRWYLSFWP